MTADKRDNKTCRKRSEALRLLLKSRGCLAPDGRQAEIAEEISAKFDILLKDARVIEASLKDER